MSLKSKTDSMIVQKKLLKSQVAYEIDFFQTNFINLKQKENIIKIDPNGRRIFMVDCMVGKAGDYRIGVAKKLKPGLDTHGSQVSLSLFHYSVEEYMGGTSSNEEVTWLSCKELRLSELYGILITLEENVEELTIWCQGPSILAFNAPMMNSMRFSVIEYSFRKMFESQNNQKEMTYFEKDAVKMYSCFKMLAEGVGLLYMSNASERSLFLRLKFKKQLNFFQSKIAGVTYQLVTCKIN